MYAGGVIYGAGNGGGGADIAELSDTLDAGRIDEIILLGDEDDLELLDVGVHPHQVVGKIIVDVARAVRSVQPKITFRGHTRSPTSSRLVFPAFLGILELCR